MKHLSHLVLGMLLAATAASAQYRPGVKSLGGTFDFDIPESGPQSITIAPSLSYALSEKVAVGAEAIFGGEGEVRIFGIAPFLRGNLALNDKAGAFARAFPVFLYGDLGTDLSSTTFGFGADAGLYYWISQHFSVELTVANLAFLKTSVDFDGTELADETNFTGSVDPSDVTVSVFYHF
ncbi:MAG TPA: hypothetical protein VHO02_02600 [Fibrobacteria bacterium]|jgi:hypothetical protein|nr:hypothetical protein [Fibrobacteria bacterium]